MSKKTCIAEPRSDVQIRALEPEDWKATIKWRRDERTWDFLVGQKRFVSTETEKRWVLRAIEQHERGEALRFGILIGKDPSLVGMIMITEIDHQNRSCASGYLLSPDGARGKGVAFAARLLVYRYVFEELGMNRIFGRVLEDNVASRRFNEKFGTVYEGTLRKAVLKNGVFKNLLVYSMLREEFDEMYGKVSDPGATTI